jgi:type-F conjugative transfer system pilin assembly protein TrbC
MLSVLILLISILGSNEIFESVELNLKTVVAEAEQAALIEKKSVETLMTQTKNNVMQNQNPQKIMQEGRCPLAGCTRVKASLRGSEKTSPLLDAKKPLVFVSATMPIESLKRLAYQAKQHGTILVIRGMVKNSMTETATLVDQIDHPLEIDPKLFERFGFKQVPVFVIPHQTSWHKVSGNVELNFALEKAIQKGIEP